MSKGEINMKQFWLKTQVHKFNTIEEFSKQFEIGEEDLLFTQEFLYNDFVKPLNINVKKIMFLEKYGVGEPSKEMVEAILSDLKGVSYNRVIAIGGGSVMDVSKILALKTPNSIGDLYEKTELPVKEKQLIIIPTTCGTGSEVTDIAVLKFIEKHSKVGLVTNEYIADYAVLIPDIVKNLPYEPFIYSSVDALIHAVESFVAQRATSYSQIFAEKAIEIIIKGYKEILEKGPEYRKEIIEDFIVGSNYAGIAFYNSGVGGVHALSFPLGGQYNVPHGESNYRCFIEIFITYFKKAPTGKILELNAVLANALGVENNANVYGELEKLLSSLIAEKKLREYGMKEEEIYSFTDSVISCQQRLLINNHVAFTKEDIVDIYKKLY
jgi:4-hydroxybutyrate dehydrogenase